MALAAIFLFGFRNDIGPLFVDDARVGREVAGVAPICAAYQMPDGVYGVASGVLRYPNSVVIQALITENAI